MIPRRIFDQIADKCTEGLALALARDDDGAVMELQWCNKAFTKITGHASSEVIGQRGTILIGSNMEQGKHLRIIEKLMNWEHFSIKVLNNRKKEWGTALAADELDTTIGRFNWQSVVALLNYRVGGAA